MIKFSRVTQISNMEFSPIQLTKGCFRLPGKIHLHVDGRDKSLITEMSDKIQALGLTGKENTILKSVKGPSFKEDAHNAPGRGLERFLSIPIVDRGEAVEALKTILGLLRDATGVVIEAERVLGYMSTNRAWTGDHVITRGGISDFEVGFKNSESDAIEIHHCFELIKSSTDQIPLTLAELARELEQNGLSFRTWSLFERSDVWSYRSTDFASVFDFDRRSERDFEILSRYLRTKHLSFQEVWVVVEEVLGIWQTPLRECKDKVNPNVISIESLIGAADLDIRLAELIDQCRAKQTDGVAETNEVELEEIRNNLAPFERIIRNRGLDPILIELSINDDLPSTSHWKSPVLSRRWFAAHMVSYEDTTSFDVLRGWERAIDAIVARDGLQIDPIVSHPETYGSGLLYDAVHEWAKEALSICARGQIDELKNHAAPMGQSDKWTIAGSRRLYSYEAEEKPAPIYNTVRTLSQGFVYELMKLVSDDVLAPENRDVRLILTKLLGSHLLIVPFGWHSPGVALDVEKTPTTIVNPGGCLFSVIATRNNSSVVEELNNLGLRLGWVLHRAALEAAWPDRMLTATHEPDWDIKLKILRDGVALRKAFSALKSLPPADRLAHLCQNAPFLNSIHQNITATLKRELNVNSYSKDDLIWEIMSLHYKTGKAKYYRWKREAESKGIQI